MEVNNTMEKSVRPKSSKAAKCAALTSHGTIVQLLREHLKRKHVGAMDEGN